MTNGIRTAAGLLACATLILWTSGCVWIVHSVDTKPVAPLTGTLATKSPVKVHLLDGSIVMFRAGATLAADTLRGAGTRYDRTVSNWSPVSVVPRDSVAAMEVFDTKVDDGPSVLFSALTTVTTAGLVYMIVSGLHIGPVFSSPGMTAARHP
jgi:hypothetical protein